MNELYRWVGHLGSLGGVLLGLVAIIARVSGTLEVVGVLRGTLLLSATFALALGCAGYLASIVQGQGGAR
jgi:hypothetical protein